MGLIDNLFGLWWVAVTSTIAGIAILTTGFRALPSRLRIPIGILGTTVTALAFSYWWDLFTLTNGPAQMRRGAGVVLYPSIGWTYIAVLRYAHQQSQLLRFLLNSHGDDDPGDDE